MVKRPLRHWTKKKLGEGRYYPLGATLHDDGVNFAIYSKHASEVYLLLFDTPFGEATDIIKLKNVSRYVWHIYVYGVKAGQYYGYKIKGDHDPANGLRFNHHKLLIDPYAKAISSKAVNKDNLLLAYQVPSKKKDRSFDTRDNTRIVPKSIVIDDKFDWQADVPPDIPLEKSIIYEVHLKGFTAHASSRVRQPGTYLGFIEKIPHLKKLGITAVELLPVQEFYNDDFILQKGLKNYWGYNTIGFFAPESSYSSSPAKGAQVKEFKTLVRELHKAGIEVIMDVVYNHTGEGSELGPTISFKGIDNPTYYCLKGTEAEPARFYENYSGCGNCINASDGHVTRFILDSLRYWVEVMHVDGFRFDLASILGRQGGEFSSQSAFFSVISQDPVLNRIKLIAEPWDIETYQVGNFPVDWSELNDRFRDTVRKFGKGDPGQIHDLKYRLSGSPDLYGKDGRKAHNSINFVTCHDGFTLYDLVSYDRKHNKANHENNRDGRDENYSWNCGAEGDTDDPEVLGLRKRLVKNYMCYLLLSAGTPYILGGDELLRTQHGNNNAYCQDNEISWFDWRMAKANSDHLRFCAQLIAFVKKHKELRFMQNPAEARMAGMRMPSYRWMGKDLNDPDLDDPEARTLSLHVSGGDHTEFFTIFNADHKPQDVTLPVLPDGKRWYRKIDTSLTGGEDFTEEDDAILIDPDDHYFANARSTVLLIGI